MLICDHLKTFTDLHLHYMFSCCCIRITLCRWGQIACYTMSYSFAYNYVWPDHTEIFQSLSFDLLFSILIRLSTFLRKT